MEAWIILSTIVSIILSLVFAFICSEIAKDKNRDAVAWFIIGFLIGVIGIIIIACLGDNGTTETAIINLKKAVRNKNVQIVCNKCGNRFEMDRGSLENVDVVVCAKCQNEIRIRGEENRENKEESDAIEIPTTEFESKDKDYFTVDCPVCKQELTFPTAIAENNEKVECPYCKANLIIK